MGLRRRVALVGLWGLVSDRGLAVLGLRGKLLGMRRTLGIVMRLV